MNQNVTSVFDCNGARLRAQSRRLATVVTISGEITERNIEQVTNRARHYVLADDSVVLDLSDVRRFDGCAQALLEAIDQDCAAAGVEWVLIASPEVLTALDSSGDGYSIAASVAEALSYFADETLRRRTLLLPLLTKSA